MASPKARCYWSGCLYSLNGNEFERTVANSQAWNFGSEGCRFESCRTRHSTARSYNSKAKPGESVLCHFFATSAGCNRGESAGFGAVAVRSWLAHSSTTFQVGNVSLGCGLPPLRGWGRGVQRRVAKARRRTAQFFALRLGVSGSWCAARHGHWIRWRLSSVGVPSL
jgi:hypothetical protein